MTVVKFLNTFCIQMFGLVGSISVTDIWRSCLIILVVFLHSFVELFTALVKHFFSALSTHRFPCVCRGRWRGVSALAVEPCCLWQ